MRGVVDVEVVVGVVEVVSAVEVVEVEVVEIVVLVVDDAVDVAVVSVGIPRRLVRGSLMDNENALVVAAVVDVVVSTVEYSQSAVPPVMLREALKPSAR